MRPPAAALLPLAEVGGGDRGRAGGKAAALGELRRRGLPVLDGVVLPPGVAVSAAVVDELDAARVRFGGRVAVRSSAVDEDTAGSSAAGRYVTVLDVADRHALEAAVRACRESASRGSGRAMAVLVQPMVAARVTGVAFTADPVTGDRDTAVVVAGGPGAVTEGGPGEEWRLRLDAAVAAVAPGDGSGADRLAPDQVRAIVRTAARAAVVLGGPADVEWAVEWALGDGQLTVLQARPMTALPAAVEWSTGLPGGWLRNFRLGEWLPGPVTPLFDSWFLAVVEARVRRLAAAEAGLVMRPPLHVLVEGWYFHAPLGTAPVRTLLGAIVRNPRFALGSILVRARPEWTERMVVRRFRRRWREDVLPGLEDAARRLGGSVAGDVDPGELWDGVDAAARAVGATFWSLSMVGGFAWKLEDRLRRLLRPIGSGEATRVAAWLALPPAEHHLAARRAVQSLDWIHPVRATEPGEPRRPAPPDLAAARAAVGRRRWRRVERLARLANGYSRLREEQSAALTGPWPALRDAVRSLGRCAVAADALADADDVWFLHRRELEVLLAGGAGPVGAELARRRAVWRARHRLTPPLRIGTLPGPVAGLLPAAPDPARGALVTGQPAAPGRAAGTVLVAADLASAEAFATGRVLVAPLVTPAWIPVLARTAAVVTDGGTIAAHSAVVCRELGVPLVVATGDATRRLVSGEVVLVDGALGTVVPAP